MKILLIRLSSIGDCVMASSVVAALREAHPGAHIAWVVQSKSVGAVRGLEGVDEVFEWSDKNGRWRGFWQIARQIRRAHFDVVVDLQGLDKAALFMLASGAKRRITGESARRFPRKFATETVPEERKIHARDFYFGRVAPLGIAPDVAERFFPILPIKAEHFEFATRFLTENGVGSGDTIFGFNLGASVEVNRWAPENFAHLAFNLLKNPGAKVILFGAPADTALLEEFQRSFAALNGEKTEPRVVVALGKTNLMQLAALSKKCECFLTADTGPMHIAAAVGAPVLALFGPARIWRTAPIQNPANAEIRVLEASKITGTWPAPMSAHSVESVEKAMLEMSATKPENEVVA
ncbi:MAG TPA: glycosyltransferase family 9 protein [Abditibacterium sp.]|jgi:ADP-heptose:LPS heptosyltransferase